MEYMITKRNHYFGIIFKLFTAYIAFTDQVHITHRDSYPFFCRIKFSTNNHTLRLIQNLHGHDLIGCPRRFEWIECIFCYSWVCLDITWCKWWFFLNFLIGIHCQRCLGCVKFPVWSASKVEGVVFADAYILVDIKVNLHHLVSIIIFILNSSCRLICFFVLFMVLSVGRHSHSLKHEFN